MDITRATKELFRKILPAILLVVLTVAALVWFLDAAKQSYRAGELEPHFKPAAYVPSGQAANVDVESWMTFDYLNVVYKLPPSYLSDTLDIIDSKYPNLRIDAYAKDHDLDQSAFTGEVRQAVLSALSAH